MNRQEVLASLQSRGFRAWQANFVASFLEADSPAFQLLTGPPGSGKMYTSIAIAAELVSRGAKRILVLAPAAICEAWRERLTDAQSKIPVVFVTRPVFREMEAVVPIGRSPWCADGIYVISQDLAKQYDLAAEIDTVEWDLVIGDGANRFAAQQRAALLERLAAAKAFRRLLLLSSTKYHLFDQLSHSSPEQPVRFPTPLEETSWFGDLANWDGSSVDRAEVKLEVFLYERGTDEVKCLSQFLGPLKKLQANGGGAEFFLLLLTQRASSSLFAFEQSLRRLGHTLRSVIAEADVTLAEPSAELSDPQVSANADFDTMAGFKRLPWTDKASALTIVNQCIEALEMIYMDEKLNAFKLLVRSIIDANLLGVPMICVFSMYSDTVSYLHTAIDDLGLTLFKVNGATSFSDRQALVERFVNEGGIILGTDGALSEGIAIPQVTHVIHYDLPPNPVVLDQRRGRFDRFGRNKPLTMYVLRDESQSISSESNLIELLSAKLGTGTDGV